MLFIKYVCLYSVFSVQLLENYHHHHDNAELINHLADILKMITDYEQKLKHKHKKTSQINIDKILNSENVSHKQTSR